MQEGEVLIGGVNVNELNYDTILKNIAIVFQKTFLTRDSVLENIRMGSDASLEKVRAAAREAQIDDFIMSLPDGYDTKVGSFGSRFSGGEKQRIAIARAILKNAPILILDEATSASDPENQMEIDKAIQNLCKGRTVIVVAHRLSALKIVRPCGCGREPYNYQCRHPLRKYGKRTLTIKKHGRTTKQRGKLLINWKEAGRMNPNNVWKKNREFYIGVAGTVLEGLLSGSLFMLLYSVMRFLWDGQFDMNRVLVLTAVIAVIFLFRILIYSYGYTKAQIGGARVSKNIRLFMGDHLKRIPISRFTRGQTGDYINTITSDVNNYEKILTHKIGDIAKNFALSLMLIVFVMTIYFPAGLILLTADLLLFPGLWLSFRQVAKYGKEKNDICAENVSSIVEYVSGIQTFRAYGVGGLKNKTVIHAMQEFSRISFVYEAKVLPIGAGFGILSWLSCPVVIWTAYGPWAAGTLDTVSYLLICMLPLFCAKLANSIFVDLTSYKNLMISKNKIMAVMKEPEETGSMEPLQAASHEIVFDHVDFSYVPGEPVLKQASFTVPDQKLTAIVGDSGSGKSTILNLIAKYYEVSGGTISIGGRPINHVAAERVLDQISMVDQDVFLFDDTVRENIRYARPDATDAEIEVACREANCDGFIRKMEKGYDMPIGENGNLLSGGERQRLSIARAILKNSPILLLDEATASLDIENELAVKQAIANLLKEKKTVVMVAHTLSIVKNADQILVVSDGRITEAGTHKELLKKNGKYAAMWDAEQKNVS